MKKDLLKNNKGISMIALIITILVMLILAVVVVNITTDSKIFTKGEESKRKLNEQEIFEKISVSAHTKNTGGIDVKQTYLNSKGTLEEQGKTVNLIYPDTEEKVSYVSRVIIEVKDRNETFKYTIKNNEILIGEEKYDFELKVQSNYSGNAYSYSRRITLKPDITADFFNESEAATILGKELGITGIDSLEKLNIGFFNSFNKEEGSPIFGMDDVSDSDSLKNSLSSIENSPITENSTQRDIFDYYMYLMYQTDEHPTLEQLALESYEPEEISAKVSLNGEKIVDPDITIDDDLNGVHVVVDKNGTYEFEVQLDGKIGAIIYEVTEVANIGKYVKYDSDGDGSYNDEILFKILYEEGELGENSGAQIIVADVTNMPSITLGENDANIIEAEVVEIGDSTDKTFERALWSYDNAVETLNNACEQAIKLKDGITKSVRSVGTNPLSPYAEEENGYIAEEDLTNHTDTTWFSQYSGKIKKINNNTQDTQKISANNYLFAEESGTTYWTCTKNFRLTHMVPNFGMGFGIGNYTLGIVYKTGTSQGAVASNRFVEGFDTQKIRPIVILEYGVLSKAIEEGNGNGTKESPILLK